MTAPVFPPEITQRTPAMRLRDRLPLTDKIRFLLWRAGLLPETLCVTVDSGQKLVLRRGSVSDLNIAYELFCTSEYAIPAGWSHRKPVRTYVDLGSNVGMTVVYFGLMFPEAEILAYEPGPSHVEQIRKNVEANGLTSRVTIRPVAVSNRSSSAYLTDEGTGSRLVDQPEPGAFPIEVVDWHEETLRRGQPIDVLKVDIEGFERVILDDPRFADLEIGSIVLEWHELPGSGAHAAIKKRLQDLGYHLTPGGEPHGPIPGLPWAATGMIWAHRPT